MNPMLSIDISAMDILIIATLIAFIVILFAALAMLKAFRTVIKLTMPDLETEEIRAQKEKIQNRNGQTFWQKVIGLRPIEEEEDLLIDHTYDGIQELDNPTPTWFNALFYSSIVFAVGYLLVYHVFSWGMNQDQEYRAEMEAAEIQRMEFLATSGTNIDENSVVLDLSPAMIGAGQEIYLQSCGVCHGNQGEGMIGPNFTDEYWIHGGDIKDIFRVIKYGVPDKGMVPWEASLTPIQISQVANFIITLGGTNPPNQKEAQGEKHEPKPAAEEISAAINEEI